MRNWCLGMEAAGQRGMEAAGQMGMEAVDQRDKVVGLPMDTELDRRILS
jgi:hypothetical protein